MKIEDYISKTLFERSLIGIILLPEGEVHLQYCNEAFSRLLGYASDELKQKTLEEVTHREDWTAEHRDEQAILSGEIDYSRAEKRFIHKNGDSIWTESVTTISRDEQSGKTCLIKFIQDISEHRKSLRKIEQQEHFLRNITDAVPTLITVKNKEGKYTMVNLAAAEFYGITVGDMEGITDAELGPHAGDPEKIRRDDLDVLETKQDKFILEQVVRDATGRSHTWQVYRRPIYVEAGNEYQILTICTDVTEYKKIARSLSENEKKLRQEQTLLEEKIKRRAVELDAQNIETQELLQTHKKLMSVVSRDVQSAWNDLQPCIESMVAGEKIQAIQKIKNNLASSIDAMLALTRLETDASPVLTMVPISQVEQKIKIFLQEKIKNRKLRMECASDVRASSLLATGTYLSQTLEYLLLMMDQITPPNGEMILEIRSDKHERIFNFIFKNEISEIAVANLARFFHLEDMNLGSTEKFPRALPALLSRLVKMQRGELRVDASGAQGVRLILSLPWEM
ncbi:MAG: PAS domain-containing protein [Verrucomicrobiota bacterium]